MAAAVADSKLIEVPPTVFNGDRTKSDQFLHDFSMYRALNYDHRIMQSPYLRILLALQYIKGPLVQDWANDYVTEMNARIHRQVNPILENSDVHWTSFLTDFRTAYTDTALQQTAYHQLQQLRMKGHDLDQYVARFKHLCTKAGVDRTQLQTISMFARGLERKLLNSIIHNAKPNMNTTFNEWVTYAHDQQKNDAYSLGLLHPDQSWIRWQTPAQSSRSHHHGHHRGHTNGTPMDVDIGPVARVYKA